LSESSLVAKYTTSITYNILHRKLQSSSRELKLNVVRKWGKGAIKGDAQAVRRLPVLRYQTPLKYTSPKYIGR
jgi:hypothetical protein